ncbi:hypothetical protein BH11CYA1_BH11CYA1_44230 [soil metagenome]
MTKHESQAEKSEHRKHKADEASGHLSRFANGLPSENHKNEIPQPVLPKLDLVKSSKLDKNSGATRTVLSEGAEVTEYPDGGKTEKTIGADGTTTLVIHSSGRPTRIAQFDTEGAVKAYSDGTGNIYTSEMVADEKDATKQKRAWTITTKDGQQCSFDGTVGGDNTGSIVVRDNTKAGGDYAERRLNNGTVIRSDKDNLDRTVETAKGLTIQNKSEFKVRTVYVDGDSSQTPNPVEVQDTQPSLVSKTLTYPDSKGSMELEYDTAGNISRATRTVDGVAENISGAIKETNGQVEITNNDGQFILTNSGKMVKVDPTDKLYEPQSFDAPPDPESSPVIQEVPASVDLDANIKEAESHQYKFLAINSYVTQELNKYVWFYNKVKPGADWDYKVKGMQYEDFGNFNYGVTAAAAGIRLEVALREAGRAQTVKKKEWGEPGNYYDRAGTGSYGDDPRDQLKIREGYEHYLKLKAEREQQAQKAA